MVTSAFVGVPALGRCFAFDPVDFKEEVYTPLYVTKVEDLAFSQEFSEPARL